MKLKAILAAVATAAAVLSSQAESWFDAKIGEYTAWPLTAQTTPENMNGTWAATGGTDTELVQETSPGAQDAKLLVCADSENPLTFQATAAKKVGVSCNAMSISAAVKFEPFTDANQDVPENAKVGIFLYKGDTTYRFYVLADDDGSLAWVPCTGDPIAIASFPEGEIPVSITIGADSAVSYAIGTDGSLATYSGTGVLGDGQFQYANFTGDGTVSSLSATYDIQAVPYTTPTLPNASVSPASGEANPGTEIQVTYTADPSYVFASTGTDTFVTTGTLQFDGSMTFSETPVAPVKGKAKIGTTYYLTLNAALEAAAPGATVELCEAGDLAALTKNVNIALGGYTLTLSGDTLTNDLAIAGSGNIVAQNQKNINATFDVSALTWSQTGISGTIVLGSAGVFKLPSDVTDPTAFFASVTASDGALVYCGEKSWVADGGSWKKNFFEQDKDGNYLIAEKADLELLRAKVAAGDTFTGKTFKQTQTIDFNNVPWVGIGVKGSATQYFGGTYDGQNFSLLNVKLAATNSYCGVFNRVIGAEFKNLTINLNGIEDVDWSVETKLEAGGAAFGQVAASTFRNITTTGSMYGGNHNLAALVVTSTVVNDKDPNEPGNYFYDCTNKASVVGAYTKVAGFMALAASKVGVDRFIRCSNEGNISTTTEGRGVNASKVPGANGVGAFISYTQRNTYFEDCVNTGTLTCNATGICDTNTVGTFVAYFNNGEYTNTLAGVNKGMANVRSVGFVYPVGRGDCKDLFFATVSDGVATMAPVPTSVGDYQVMMANAAAIELDATPGTLTLDTTVAPFTGTVALSTAAAEDAYLTGEGPWTVTAKTDATDAAVTVDPTSATYEAGLEFPTPVVTKIASGDWESLWTDADENTYTAPAAMSAGDPDKVYTLTITVKDAALIKYKNIPLTISTTFTVSAPAAEKSTTFTISYGTGVTGGETSYTVKESDDPVEFTLKASSDYTIPVFSCNGAVCSNTVTLAYGDTVIERTYTVVEGKDSPTATEEQVKDAIKASIDIADPTTRANVETKIDNLVTGTSAKKVAGWIKNREINSAALAAATETQIEESYLLDTDVEGIAEAKKAFKMTIEIVSGAPVVKINGTVMKTDDAYGNGKLTKKGATTLAPADWDTDKANAKYFKYILTK